MWDVWRVHYMTTAERAERGDLPRECVARGLSLERARELVASLGFGHSMHPA